MPRSPRILPAGQPVHVVQRGVNRCVVFVTRADFIHYRTLMKEVSLHVGCDIHAYTLMSNHTHLLVTPRGDDSVSELMRAVGGRYARYFNDRQGRTGALWGERFHSSIIDSEGYFLRTSRYIERNAWKAGIVHNHADHEWSSFRANALGLPDPVVTPHEILLSLGNSDSERREAYRHLFGLPVDEEAESTIREAIRTNRSVSAIRWRREVKSLLLQRSRQEQRTTRGSLLVPPRLAPLQVAEHVQP